MRVAGFGPGCAVEGNLGLCDRVRALLAVRKILFLLLLLAIVSRESDAGQRAVNVGSYVAWRSGTRTVVVALVHEGDRHWLAMRAGLLNLRGGQLRTALCA